MATKKKADAKSTVKKSVGAKKAEPKSMPKAGKDPKGGLTAEGREYFAEKEGSHLRPGVRGKADTPEKKVRKGSFLRRHFANPRGPMEKDGQPTRLALSAQAWGEPLPKTSGDAKKLAGKGKKLLDEYHQAKDDAAGKKTAKKTGAKTAAKKPVAKSAASTRAEARPAKKAAAKRATPKHSGGAKAASKTKRTDAR